MLTSNTRTTLEYEWTHLTKILTCDFLSVGRPDAETALTNRLVVIRGLEGGGWRQAGRQLNTNDSPEFSPPLLTGRDRQKGKEKRSHIVTSRANPLCHFGKGPRNGFLLSVIHKSCVLLRNTIFIVFSAKHSSAEIRECKLKKTGNLPKLWGCLPTCKEVFSLFVFFSVS